MNKRWRALTLVAAFAFGVGAPALAAVSNFPQVGIAFLGKGKQPRSTSLEMRVHERVGANSAVCWLYTREGRAKNNARITGEVTIHRPSGQDEVLGPLTSTVDYLSSQGNSLGCGCAMSQLPILPGDDVRGDFRLRRVGKLKVDESGYLVIWVFDGVVIPGGILIDCATFFPRNP